MLHITTIKLLSFGSNSVLSCNYSIVKQIWKLLDEMIFTTAIAGFLTLAAPEMSSFENTFAFLIHSYFSFLVSLNVHLLQHVQCFCPQLFQTLTVFNTCTILFNCNLRTADVLLPHHIPRRMCLYVKVK